VVVAAHRHSNFLGATLRNLASSTSNQPPIQCAHERWIKSRHSQPTIRRDQRRTLKQCLKWCPSFHHPITNAIWLDAADKDGKADDEYTPVRPWWCTTSAAENYPRRLFGLFVRHSGSRHTYLGHQVTCLRRQSTGEISTDSAKAHSGCRHRISTHSTETFAAAVLAVRYCCSRCDLWPTHDHHVLEPQTRAVTIVAEPCHENCWILTCI